jgi:hypothetical protein
MRDVSRPSAAAAAAAAAAVDILGIPHKYTILRYIMLPYDVGDYIS